MAITQRLEYPTSSRAPPPCSALPRSPFRPAELRFPQLLLYQVQQ